MGTAQYSLGYNGSEGVMAQ
uniref:Uncharacterized protein n=1 Tax=Anguilla anguilla TaxID=7936 RepID=A0A0E9S6J0_ANGAN